MQDLPLKAGNVRFVLALLCKFDVSGPCTIDDFVSLIGVAECLIVSLIGVAECLIVTDRAVYDEK